MLLASSPPLLGRWVTWELWVESKSAFTVTSLTPSRSQNITANSISAANDATVLFPQWINILRGQLFAVIIGVWAFAPWKVLGSAGSFISFVRAAPIDHLSLG